jgi:hypothetical protein
VNDAKLARIRALLSKAESTDFEAEAQTYREKAFALMAEHGIEEAMLAASGAVTDDIETRVIVIPAPYALDKVYLLNAIAQPLNGHVVRYKGTADMYVKLTGYASDLERIELLYTSLLLQQASGAAREMRSGWNAAQTRSNRKAWMLGFAHEVYARLKAANTVAQTAAEASTGTSTALVLRDRSKAVEEASKAANGRIRKGGARKLNGNGYTEGRAAGARADLGHRRVGGTRRALQG